MDVPFSGDRLWSSGRWPNVHLLGFVATPNTQRQAGYGKLPQTILAQIPLRLVISINLRVGLARCALRDGVAGNWLPSARTSGLWNMWCPWGRAPEVK